MLKLPLRYPGGKTQLVDYCQTFVEADHLQGCAIFEPFAGGASVSLNLLSREMVSKVMLNEKDHLLYYFWHSVFFEADELCRMIFETPITVDMWEHLANYRSESFCEGHTPAEIGFACLFLNRTSFSGLLKSNPLGGLKQTSIYGIGCRFNKEKVIESIRLLSQYHNKVEVYHEDAIDFMENHVCGYGRKGRRVFVYIDPPYYLQGKSLYRHFYNDSDHRDLARYIKTKSYSWLVSYDKHEYIEKLYKSKQIQPIYFDYSAHSTKMRQEELLISNRELPPTVYRQVELQEII